MCKEHINRAKENTKKLMDSEPEWLLLEDVGYWLAAAAKVEKCCQLKNHPPAGDFFVGSIFISKGG